MKVRMYGTRGIFPAAGKETIRYGGNTSCVQLIVPNNNDIFILDAGTGLKTLGEKLVVNENQNIHIFLSHLHWDHIMGVPFFLPLYRESETVKIYSPPQIKKPLSEEIHEYIKSVEFPIPLGSKIRANLSFHEIKEKNFEINNLKIKTMKMNHTLNCYGYRFESDGKIICYTTDHENYYANDIENEVEVKEANNLNLKHNQFIYKSDILITDAQYLPEENKKYKGWGHSSFVDALNRAINAKVKSLIFFHHDPNRTDDQLDKISNHYRKILEEKNIPIRLYTAKEGWEYVCEI
ncbi:MAG: MBL fold metallo-hydrolase [Spirochaetia bacterium]|nr:MBL fold metallo-hydrolase [Spirochaetia bacterium]